MTVQNAARTSAELLQAILTPGTPAPLTMMIQAHPDDEVIGLGAHLHRLQQGHFLHVTDGAPRDGHDAVANGFVGAHEYAEARRRELEAAMALAGVAPSQLIELSCPDQQASHCMVDLARKIARIVHHYQPELVITHPYEGGHPDHDATAFAVHAACQLLIEHGCTPPQLAEVSCYHIGPGGLEPYCFLPPNTGDAPRELFTIQLSAEQRELKERMMACFPSQAQAMRYFPVGVECLRPAPRYAFTKPPHEGRLFYEQFSWGMTGERFRELATEATRLLEVDQVL